MTRIFLCCFYASASFLMADDIDFNRDVRPILSDKCYFCHGPDEENRQAHLRLDVRESAIDLIEAGDVLDRINNEDADLLMPPPDSHLALSASEKDLLRRWIDEGAVYEEHWAFELLPISVPIPVVNDERWPHQTLDRFVLAKLDNEGVGPNKPAAPLRWLRRVTFDLTGLPPTLGEIEDFQTTHSVDEQAAYEKVVDRLLASTAFGEHTAVSWLDAARYADSYGYQSDKLNTQWPYRDWVIRSFNNNLPYDQFLTWQLAGDLLEEPSREQILATAFNRIHRLNNEGGAVFEEWRVENVADRVHTFGTAVLGLTMECCRCHDHKYDPISMRDYYALSAFFNSIDESGVYDRTEKVPCPSLLLPTPEQQATLAAAADKVRTAEIAHKRAVEAAQSRYASWKSDIGESGEQTIPDLQLALGFDRPFDNTLKSIYHPSQSDRSWTSMPELQAVEGCSVPRLSADDSADADPDGRVFPRRAILLDGERGVTTEGVEPFDRWMPFSVVVTLRETKRSPQRSVIAHHTRGTDCGYNGWDLTIADGYLESRLARVWPGNAISVRTTEPIPIDKWHQVSATYDGSSRAVGLKLFLNGAELATEIIRDELKKQANVKVDHGGQFVVGQRFRDRGLDGGLIDDVRVYSRALTPPELHHLASGAALSKSVGYFVSAIDAATRKTMASLTEARKAFVMAEEAMNEIPIMRELDNPRPAYVLARGQYDAPKNEDTHVERDTFESFNLTFPEDAPRDRLGLARWVTDPRHPLTARVAVNRLWSQFFAEPLVRTPENFGLQGELPAHPEMLDWLARDFIDNGWDVKRFCKQVALSATYRQDSRVDPETRQRDGDNKLLARGPANRLAAEQIRDLALSVSGLLNPTLGGPPVSPYQPGEDLWRESNGMSPPYEQSVGQSLYRRSLYSVWKRTAPLPNMMALDASTREVCAVKRSRTNTPIQALVLLNDTQFVEACRKLAELSFQNIDGSEGRIQRVFIRLTGRPADARELGLLLDLFETERDDFKSHAADATKLVAVGDSPPGASLNAADIAAMTVVCQAILNLDATVWNR